MCFVFGRYKVHAISTDNHFRVLSHTKTISSAYPRSKGLSSDNKSKPPIRAPFRAVFRMSLVPKLKRNGEIRQPYLTSLLHCNCGKMWLYALTRRPALISKSTTIVGLQYVTVFQHLVRVGNVVYISSVWSETSLLLANQPFTRFRQYGKYDGSQ